MTKTINKYALFILITFPVIAKAVINQSSFPEPYRSIELLSFDPHGWFNPAIETLTRTH